MALVVTIIMVAVITFLAIAFLVLSRREKGAVTTAVDQTTARLAAETALERARANLLAHILAYTNELINGLLISTNYINPVGFNAAQPAQQIDRATLFWATNVSFAYPNGQPLLPGTPDFAKAVANLYYDPRPPVLITNRLFGSNEFRYYLDLNRNGVFDATGWQPIIGPGGGYLRADGTESATPVNVLTNYTLGDPQWIGGLERPELPHSGTNRFVMRYAYLAVPAGHTLDLNYIHNEVKQLGFNNPSFSRNQGLGSWELDLAAFLVDLNTNGWLLPPNAPNAYNYVTNAQPSPLQSSGTAFEDAMLLLRYRYGGNYNNLASARALFGPAADTFLNDFIDQYADGPLMTGVYPPLVDLDDINRPWPGADNPNHFFNHQDLYDRNKTAPGVGSNVRTFSDRLLDLGRRPSTYDRTTFYRLLSQLGTDTAPEAAGKMHLNYVNVDSHGNIVPNAQTNLRSWIGIQFFTNAADRLLRDAGFRDRNGRWVTVTNIPVWPPTNNFYGPAIHRLLQLAANLYDSTTNRTLTPYPHVPSVFRPVFRRDATGVFIAGYVEELDARLATRPPPMLDPEVPADLARVRPAGAPIDPTDDTEPMLYGVPVIIGAKKGFPNFNELTLRTVVASSRLLTFRKPTAASRIVETNVVYFLGVSNTFGVEAWNPYATPYPRDLQAITALDVSVALTNEVGTVLASNLFHMAGVANYPALSWDGFPLSVMASPAEVGRSFRTLATNLTFVPDARFQFTPPYFSTNFTLAPLVANDFRVPNWRLHLKPRLRFILVDVNANRIVDYVNLTGLDEFVDIMEVQQRQDPLATVAAVPGGMWNTNRLNPAQLNSPTRGILNQILVSRGEVELSDEFWRNFNLTPVFGRDKQKAIDAFRVFFGLSQINPELGPVFNTNTTVQAPYNPANKFFVTRNWQANDPFVHYLTSDLEDVVSGRQIFTLRPYTAQPGALTNLGTVNERYQPWGGAPGKDPASDPNAFKVALKDPLIRRADDWDFPTNKYPSLGWLGRVHRGTPWQTVYFKAMPTNDLPDQTWAVWTGNRNLTDARATRPEYDRRLLNLFTTALNENAARGLLPVNQSELAAWSAALSGLIVLHNGAHSDRELRAMWLTNGRPVYLPGVLEPAGIYDPLDTNNLPPLVRLVTAINDVRRTNLFHAGRFRSVGDLLDVPELTLNSPFLNLTPTQRQLGISDAVYERLPQQIFSLLTAGSPRFVVYAYGQALKPAERSVIPSGPFFGLCTNYQIAAETAIRSVWSVEGSPDPRDANHPNPARRYPPRVVVESFNFLPPD